jgi:hypothetical protein
VVGRAASLALALGLVVSSGCGPIAAPPGVTDLRESPHAFAQAFDAAAGRRRLLLLLSPG